MVEVYLPARHPPSAVPEISAVRSTVIVTALRAVRERGLHARYLELLRADLRPQFDSLVAGQWLPMTLGLEHYRAMDGLGLDAATSEAIGGEVGERMNRSVLSVALKASKGVGVTPWNALSLAYRMTEMSWQGGDVAVWKAGPKDAIYQWAGQPCAGIPYFQSSFGGLLRGLALLFCTRAYCKVDGVDRGSTTLRYRISWA